MTVGKKTRKREPVLLGLTPAAGRGVREDAEEPGRYPAERPRDAEPEAERDGAKPCASAQPGSHPGTKRHGGQAAVLGVMGSRTLSPAENRIFTGAPSAPTHGSGRGPGPGARTTRVEAGRSAGLAGATLPAPDPRSRASLVLRTTLPETAPSMSAG
ncbi:hypothetical protein GCM10010381_41600 [Streptomyces xantholiticus]|nr:hypothetical protein GCM10010381_41600 [Streptomyces xantholiticus]